MVELNSVIFILTYLIHEKCVNSQVVTLGKPNGINWPGKYDGNRNVLGDWLLNGDFVPLEDSREYEYEGYDGWYNNIAKPDSGAIDRPLLRRVANAYKDGVYSPSGENRPNPLELSEKLLSGDIGTKSMAGRNAFLVFFGQQVVEEILDSQRAACPPEYFNIQIPAGHNYIKQYGHSQLPFLRTRYDQRTGYSPNNPRQQLNEITPYLDGGLFYGITKQWSDQLRTYENGTIDKDGKLASSFNGAFPALNTERLPMANPPPPFHHGHYIKKHETEKVSRFFKLGNPRGNENAFLLTFGVLWFRWHNYLADRLRDHYPNWSSEKVYNEARKWTIATQQKIVVYDWLKQWVSRPLKPYSGYDPSVDPQIDQFFQAAAFRFGHTLVVPGVYLRDYVRSPYNCKTNFKNWKNKAVRTCNIFWRPQDPLVNTQDDNGSIMDIDRLIMGMTVQLSEKEDHRIVEDLRGNVFGPLEFPRRDLMAINIQRGRDHGLPDYNTARRAYGLETMTFEKLNAIVKNDTIIGYLRDLYNNDINNIDPWVGGILETTEEGPGSLFSAVILDQFNRIRNGDRFWFENYEMNQLFTIAEVERIRQISIYDVIMAVTKMDANDIPKNPFRVPMTNTGDDDLIKMCLLKNTPSSRNITYYHLEQLNQENLNESCVPGSSYDYFFNSEISFILTFSAVSAFIFGTAGVGFLLIKLKENKEKTEAVKNEEYYRKSAIRRSMRNNQPNNFIVSATEKIDVKSTRKILVGINDHNIEVESLNGKKLRALEFKNEDEIILYYVSDEPTLIIRSKHTYDLVLKFDSIYLRDQLEINLEGFISKLNLKKHITKCPLKSIKINTQSDRLNSFNKFYRVVFAQAFGINHSSKEILIVDSNMDKEIAQFEMTPSEFAECLKMKPSNEFVKKLFNLTDMDKNGFISFKEFFNLLIIFAKGDANEKANLLFKMHDIDNTGQLSRQDFVDMMKSFLENVKNEINEDKLEQTISKMLKQANLNDKETLNFDDFKQILGSDIKSLNSANLGFKQSGSKKSRLEKITEELESIYFDKEELKRFQGEATEEYASSSIIDEEQESIIAQLYSNNKPKNAIIRYVEQKSMDIFWLALYTLVLLAIFAERAYYYSVEREHSGLRRIAGYGVTITRGAASAMMFTYSSLLVTMCRNTITYLRGTLINKYFPIDSTVFIHKYIAIWAMVFSIIHIIGHAFNFYHISTQPADDLTCLFRNYFHATHELPKFHYWCWQTMTGFTGIILTLIWGVMYTFTLPIVRSKLYNWFWYTHNLYPLFYIFMILHGTGRLIQTPFTYYFLLGPLILFIIDTLVSLSRNKVKIPVDNVEILPSGVTMLRFKKPLNFQHKSGQWVRIASLALNKNEYHPFTISSSPHEPYLTIHIRAVGPWTRKIRKIYQDYVSKEEWPMIYLDGPFGDSHQDWYTYDISILVGAGIGVTPFASILKDIASGGSQNRCKKVYFIWSSRSQKGFEWMLDIIREVENKDERRLVSCHIYITEFYQKYDLRTTLLYILEKKFQRFSNKSLFTNLQAVTHFGRPSFKPFFKTVQNLHQNAQRIGVFTCGPVSVSQAVEEATTDLNKSGNTKFEHHYNIF